MSYSSGKKEGNEDVEGEVRGKASKPKEEPN